MTARHRCNRLGVLSLLCGVIVGCEPARYQAAMRVPTLQQSVSVRPLFDFRSPGHSPFPSDRFTVADPNQNTGLRVNLPMPQDCAVQASECEDIAVLNQLDGFNIQARISVPFDGDIDPATVTSETVFIVRLSDASKADRLARTSPQTCEVPFCVGINRVVWDPTTRELSFHPDVSLDEHTTYALLVTRKVRDATGNRIGVARGFAIPSRGSDVFLRYVRRDDIALANVFTTQTVSHMVARMRELIQQAPASRLNLNVGAEGARAVFDAAQIQSLTNNADVNPAGPLTPAPIPIQQMRIIPGAVGTMAFGTFRSFDFTTRPSGHVAPIPTRTGTLRPTGTLDTAFDLWLPSGTPPAGGWPIAIYGHGSFGHKNSAVAHAAVFTSHGIAVIAINALGRGGGPRTTMTIQLTDGKTMTFAAPGLGWDGDGDGTIAPWEPRRASRPQAILNTSGSIAQAIGQYFALVRALQSGVDVNDDGSPEINGSRIYYVGQSLGAMWGVPLFASEPAIRAAAFIVPGGTLIDNTNYSLVNRPGLGEILAARTPSLLNDQHGVRQLDGIDVGAPHFNENLPLPNQPPRVNTVPGAIHIQKVMDRIAWAAQVTSSAAFAPRVRRALPTGVPARPFLIQFARSDRNLANPSTTELIRAGGFADRALMYNHEKNFRGGGVPPDPHAFFSAIGPATPNFQRIALGAQHHVATFFASDGARFTLPAPAEFWEVVTEKTLPTDFRYLPRKE